MGCRNGISRATAYKWVRRWRTEGDAGLFDRTSRPRTTPRRTASDVEERVCALRRERKLGPARIGPILGIPASTVHRVLTRHGLNRLSWMDRPTGQVIRRYERERPGELIHVDIKNLGNMPMCQLSCVVTPQAIRQPVWTVSTSPAHFLRG